MKVTAIIERASDGTYSIYTQEDFEGFGLYGYGDTVQEAKEDFFDLYREYKEEIHVGKVPDIEVTFLYDVPSFLQSISQKIGLAGLQTVTGINRKQLSHYLTGHRKPSKSTIEKIEIGIHALGDELRGISFVRSDRE